MRLLAVSYGLFSKVSKLYSRFQPGIGHLKVVIEIVPTGGFERDKFLILYRQLSIFFPTINRHSCCDEWESAPLFLEEEEGVSIKRVGESADIAHLIEHIIVDMQVNLGGMQRCSGLTCGWKHPENRFDLFVECANARVGLFAAQFAVHLVSKILTRKKISKRNGLILELAKFLLENPDTASDTESLTKVLGWKRGAVEMAHSRLYEFGFFYSSNQEDSEVEGNCA
ncbi:MAG: hypothetical protein KKG33_11640 [candidate division Zixibacteria bacterium]|nr:hypothetical protein [candidate division Zixibacteria bacterium]MBU1472100.1 hypothetical protein [candidate division Zixibacteria bacterium]MBU2626200.1 hypothetical protein [candidate division Zixibacteria bacterium]